ncbi:DoxX family protein [Mesorhizobium sp.]|nr:DoxX family protein [Mesorhizobium sp.]
MAERFLGAKWVEAVARLAVAVPFLISGAAKILDFRGSIAEVRGLTGLEPAAFFAVLVIVTQLGGSVSLIAGGRFVWIGALALAGFTTIATLSAHAFWLKPEAEQFLHRNIFFEHVSIVGGLVLLAILTFKPARTQH